MMPQGEAAAPEPLQIDELAPQARFSVRLREGDRPAFADAIGIALPDRIGERSAASGLEALCLGPDEWLLLAPASTAAGLTAAGEALRQRIALSMVKISDREQSLRLHGPLVLDALTGIARDLALLPAGSGVRTCFDAIPVVLWRDEPRSFRMDVWRSYLPHIRLRLDQLREELRCGL